MSTRSSRPPNKPVFHAPKPPAIRWARNHRNDPLIIIIEDWHLLIDLGNGELLNFTIPLGFTCDGASYKFRIVFALMGLLGCDRQRALESAIVHDYLYATALVSRREADRVFRIALHHYAPPCIIPMPLDIRGGALGRWGAWGAVRVFGKSCYNDRRCPSKSGSSPRR